TIRNMLEDIVNNEVDVESGDNVLTNGELFQFNIQLFGKDISLRGVTKSQKKEMLNNEFHSHMLSYQQLNNQDLALITIQGIYIYTIVGDFLRLRYFWNYEKYNQKDNIILRLRYFWNYEKYIQNDNIIQIIEKILAEEF